MALDILIEELEGSIWVATLNNGRLDGLEVDPVDEEIRWGSIYWAKVKSIDKALDAVYLQLDVDNVGILYNQDVRVQDEDGSFKKGGAEPIGKRFQPGDMVAVQAKTAYLPKDDGDYENKIAQMSMDITLPGRHLIFSATMQDNRISARIRDKETRKQIKTMMDGLSDIQGFILRASAANTQTDILIREGKILKEAWEQLSAYFAGDEPGLIMIGPDAIQRTLSDQATKQIERIEVVIMEHYTEAEDWCTIFAPDLVPKITPVEMENASVDFALFDYRDILGQIEDLFQSYVMLRGGGSIIIQKTAALTAIDVNRGGNKGSNLSVNIEAAEEIARQIRLRNSGGIIMIDFLKTNNKKDEAQLIAAMEKAVQGDACTVQLHGMTSLGLMEITRKRRTPPLDERTDGNIFV
ncbi:MAG: ribonuclease E [Micavibrio sp.]|nr:ribonuclease E [Micavibrio sp.]|tara:strand:+ start:158 stop:1384 length:1227 start_codon:yes stop_codon:yes gene_type:complete